MSLRCSGSETEGTDKSYLPGDNILEMKSKSGMVEDKTTFEGVFARPVPWGRPAQHRVPFGPRNGPLIPPAAIRDREPVMAPPPRATPVSSLPKSYYRSPPVPLYSKSGMKKNYGLREELHPRRTAALVDSNGEPLDRCISYIDDNYPSPEENAYKFKMEETMSPSQDKDFLIFAPPPRMVNGQWFHYTPIAYPNEGGLKAKIEKPIIHKGRVLRACEICGGMHDWCVCPLRWECRFDEKVGDDFEVVCLCSNYYCSKSSPNFCSHPFGRAALKRGRYI